MIRLEKERERKREREREREKKRERERERERERKRVCVCKGVKIQTMLGMTDPKSERDVKEDTIRAKENVVYKDIPSQKNNN